MSKKKLTPQEVKPLLVGVINIFFTPFKSETELDEEAVRENMRFMIEGGIVNGYGVQAIGGSVSQGYAFSDAEYRQLIDITVDEADGRVPICVGLERPGLGQVIELARYAEEAGADCLMALPTHHHGGHPPCPPDVVVEDFKALADATNLGIMIYNNPGMTGQDLSVELLTRLAEIDNIIALKETTPNMLKLREVLYRLGDRFAVNANTYRVLIPVDYQWGICGHNGVFANCDPAYALELEDVGRKGDFERANEIWTKGIDLYHFLRASGRWVEFIKEMARIVGRPMGVERTPLERPNEADRVKLRQLMEKAGMAVSPLQ
jgi:4-hydroxy-tetrahydrodipicolinate synthase